MPLPILETRVGRACDWRSGSHRCNETVASQRDRCAAGSLSPSGGQAKAVLLGGHTVAYMGNPRDAHGNDKLTIAAVAVPERLSAYPEVPTFKELGIEESTRGDVERAGLAKGDTSDPMVWFRNLVRQVTLDPEWRDEWEETGIIVMDEGPEVFNGIVAQIASFSMTRLSRLELLNEPRKVSWLQWMVVGLILLIGIILAIVLSQSGRQHQTASVLLGLGLAGTAVIAMAAAFELPPANAVDQLGSSAALACWGFSAVSVCVSRGCKADATPITGSPPEACRLQTVSASGFHHGDGWCRLAHAVARLLHYLFLVFFFQQPAGHWANVD